MDAAGMLHPNPLKEEANSIDPEARHPYGPPRFEAVAERLGAVWPLTFCCLPKFHRLPVAVRPQGCGWRAPSLQSVLPANGAEYPRAQHDGPVAQR